MKGQTVPDFTANDCNGNPHNLYSELNSGKVIVLCWVMPCSACTGPSLTAYNIVQSYGSSNIVFYLIDDAANTACGALNTWATNSGLGSNRVNFSTSSIVENNYGGVGMPHVAVVGPDHKAYFNALNTAAGNSSGIQNAINTAKTKSGIKENKADQFRVNITTDSGHKVLVKYTVSQKSEVLLQIFDSSGKLISKKEIGQELEGDHATDFELNPSLAGVFFLRITAGTQTQTVKFMIAR